MTVRSHRTVSSTIDLATRFLQQRPIRSTWISCHRRYPRGSKYDANNRQFAHGLARAGSAKVVSFEYRASEDAAHPRYQAPRAAGEARPRESNRFGRGQNVAATATTHFVK